MLLRVRLVFSDGIFGWFYDAPFAYHVVLPLHGALFFRTGSVSAVRTSNPSNRVEATGFACKKGVALAARTIVGFALRP